MATMLALRKENAGPTLVRVPVPNVARADDVRVRVRVAGLCRTDVLVAEGRLPCRANVILGHEFAGHVDAVGHAAPFAIGTPVAVNPVFGCGTCAICQSDAPINCPDRTMLGVEHDGAFAEYVVVSAAYVSPLGDVPLHVGAYAEPLAAALGVLRCSFGGRGVILGRNRFAILVQRVLAQAGWTDTVLHDPALDTPYPCASFGYAVETHLTEATLAEMIRLVQPCGTVILKSRLPDKISVAFLPALRKQLRLAMANYGSFAEALRLLTTGAVALEGLCGPTFAMADYARAFAVAQQGETAKVFLHP